MIIQQNPTSIITLILLLYFASSLCEIPQKAVFLSFQALSNKDQLAQLFRDIHRSVHNFELREQNRVYSILNLTYQLLYNSHYQRQEFIDKETVNVVLGPITITSRFDYTIVNQGTVESKGKANSISNLDYTSFKKQIIKLEGYLQWEPISVQKITFSSLWIIEASYQMTQANRIIFQKILNNQAGKMDLNKQIERQINEAFPSQLKNFLNREKLLSLSDIYYQYNQVGMTITHSMTDVKVVERRGIEIYLKFGLNSSKDNNCSVLPTFDQQSFGGIQEMITFSSLKPIFVQAIDKGLYNVALDRSWQVQMFQLYMGDLANAASFADSFPAASPLSITCTIFNPSNVTFLRFDQESVYVDLVQTCLIRDSGADLIKLQMQLITIATFEAEANYLSARIDRFQIKRLNFISIDPKFVVDNFELAKVMVNSVLNGLVGKECFGTKFPLLQRRYPGLFIKQQYLVVFDHSEIYI